MYNSVCTEGGFVECNKLYLFTFMFQTYAPEFIADVGLKHKLAECQFSHLFKFHKQHIGSRRWFDMKDAKGYKPLPQESGDN
jgi:hypothetical protein